MVQLRVKSLGLNLKLSVLLSDIIVSYRHLWVNSTISVEILMIINLELLSYHS